MDLKALSAYFKTQESTFQDILASGGIDHLTLTDVQTLINKHNLSMNSIVNKAFQRQKFAPLPRSTPTSTSTSSSAPASAKRRRLPSDVDGLSQSAEKLLKSIEKGERITQPRSSASKSFSSPTSSLGLFVLPPPAPTFRLPSMSLTPEHDSMPEPSTMSSSRKFPSFSKISGQLKDAQVTLFSGQKSAERPNSPEKSMHVSTPTSEKLVPRKEFDPESPSSAITPKSSARRNRLMDKSREYTGWSKLDSSNNKDDNPSHLNKTTSTSKGFSTPINEPTATPPSAVFSRDVQTKTPFAPSTKRIYQYAEDVESPPSPSPAGGPNLKPAFNTKTPKSTSIEAPSSASWSWGRSTRTPSASSTKRTQAFAEDAESPSSPTPATRRNLFPSSSTKKRNHASGAYVPALNSSVPRKHEVFGANRAGERGQQGGANRLFGSAKSIGGKLSIPDSSKKTPEIIDLFDHTSDEEMEPAKPVGKNGKQREVPSLKKAVNKVLNKAKSTPKSKNVDDLERVTKKSFVYHKDRDPMDRTEFINPYDIYSLSTDTDEAEAEEDAEEMELDNTPVAKRGKGRRAH